MQKKSIAFWTRLIDNTESSKTLKLSSKIYHLLLDLHSKTSLNSPSIENIKTILCNHGYSGIWYSQSFMNGKWLNKSLTIKLKDIYIQSWKADLDRTSDTNTYKIIKQTFTQGSSLKVLPQILTQNLIAFFTRNHTLPFETGRWQNIQVHERKYPFCDDIGDEFH